MNSCDVCNYQEREPHLADVTFTANTFVYFKNCNSIKSRFTVFLLFEGTKLQMQGERLQNKAVSAVVVVSIFS